MDYYAVFLFIYLPGFIVGFIFGLKFIKEIGIVGKLVACMLLGLLFAFIVAPIIGGTIGVIREKYTDVRDQKEATYFLSSLSGNFTDTEIVNHYSKSVISNKASNLICSTPITGRASPERIKLLADLISPYHPLIVGLIAALPEAPLELKLKMAAKPDFEGGYQYYLAINKETPPEVLKIIALNGSNNSNKILEIVAKNPNTPVDSLLSLSQSEHWDVANAAKANLKRGRKTASNRPVER